MGEREAFILNPPKPDTPHQVLASGDHVFYLESEGKIHEFRISPKGIELIAVGVDLLGLFVRSYNPKFFEPSYRVKYGRSSVVLKEELGETNVAVKSVDPKQDLSGLEQFKAIRVLEEAGVHVASPLIASKTRMINLWLDGYRANDSQEAWDKFPDFFWRLGNLTKQLAKTPSPDDPAKPTWQRNWHLDCNGHNYRIGDISSRIPVDWFTAIDPVTYRPVPTHELYMRVSDIWRERERFDV